MVTICVVLIIIIYMIALYKYYDPAIWVIPTRSRYKVFLWYNKRKFNSTYNRVEVIREYIHLLTI